MSKDPRMAKAIVDAGRATMDAAKDFGWYAAHLLLAAGWKWKKRPSEAFQPSLEEKVFHRLDAPFKDWLLEVNEGSDPVARRERWFDVVERVVLEEAAVLQQGAGPQAVIGRLIPGIQEEQNLVSAATAMTHLRRSLRKHLPRERVPAGGMANPVTEPTEGVDQ